MLRIPTGRMLTVVILPEEDKVDKLIRNTPYQLVLVEVTPGTYCNVLTPEEDYTVNALREPGGYAGELL
jgi:hypothetical protein